MSLVPTYVRASNGKFYKNPVLSGDGWFICFDDDDPEEIVITKKNILTPEKIFDLVGIKYSNLKKQSYGGSRMFGKKFKPANNWFFTLKNNLNPKYITRHDGAFEDIIGDCVFLDPENPEYQ